MDRSSNPVQNDDIFMFPPHEERYLDSITERELRGVRTRRVLAFIMDITLIAIIASFLFVVLGLATFGLSWLILPPLFPIIAFIYNGLGLSGRKHGTWGMRAAGLVVRRANGRQVSFFEAAIHALLYYVTVTVFAPALLVCLVSDYKRCLHDMLADVIFLRR